MRRLRHLEHQCTNMSLASERHLSDIRRHVLAELMKAQNLSNSIERELLEQKLEDVQLKVRRGWGEPATVVDGHNREREVVVTVGLYIIQ